MEEHREILNALRSRDIIRAEKAVRDHISITRSKIKKTITAMKQIGLKPETIHLDEVDMSG